MSTANSAANGNGNHTTAPQRRFSALLSLPKLNTNHNTMFFGDQSGRQVASPGSLEHGDGSSMNGKVPGEDIDPPEPLTILDFFLKHVTFYRLHLAAFTFIPLIAAGIFYASNGRFPVSFIDSVFICYSCMTVTGLSTINLSTITVWQQVILYILMIMGDITTVSWIMVLIRKRFFRTHCEYTVTIRKHRSRKHAAKHGPKKSRSMFLRSISSPKAAFRQRQPAPFQPGDDPLVSEPQKSKPDFKIIVPTPSGSLNANGGPAISRPMPSAIPEEVEPAEGGEQYAMSDARTFSSSPKAASIALPDLDHLPEVGAGEYGMAGMTLSPSALSGLGSAGSGSTMDYGVTTARQEALNDFGVTSLTSPRTIRYHPMMENVDGRPRPRRGATMLNTRSYTTSPGGAGPATWHETRVNDSGGFPGPIHLVNMLAKRAAPGLHGQIKRKMTMIPSVQTLDEKKTPWLSFSGLVVGRNSDFRTESLSDDQVEQVGGAEYRALRLLSYLVPSYFVGCQLISFLVFGPWMASSGGKTYEAVFAAQPRVVNKVWYSLFQVMGAYTGGGTSLVDMGMVPFQRAYLMIFGMMFSILAGNHALPIFMRFIIWVCSKTVSEGSGPHQALSFLLDHPRRCYLYLFPSHQTWFLLLCLVAFSLVEWGSFLVLNIGLPAYESIPAGVRVLAGLFQGLAARASGFAIVPLSSMAPSLLFLYVVMMYIAIYPVALSIRSTNVYEERSLGVFEKPPDDEDEEPEELHKIESRKERVGRYVGWHLRRQMSVDIWWLVWGLFLVIVIERGNIMDEDKKWFDIFRIIFELVSAFGGIGLTLGVPYDNFSFVGSFKTLSKLVVIVIMVRGRHRGLPVAVDRAVQLPRDLVVTQRKSTQFFSDKQLQDPTNVVSPTNGNLTASPY